MKVDAELDWGKKGFTGKTKTGRSQKTRTFTCIKLKIAEYLHESSYFTNGDADCEIPWSGQPL